MVGDIPSHAYIPGQTERHAEGSFDHIRDTVHDGMTPEELAQSDAFRIGLEYLDTGYFWEAHELLEPVWMILPESSDERRLLQALIQFANAQLKQKMLRPKAAIRLCGIVLSLLSGIESDIVLGLVVADIVRKVDSFEISM